MSATLERPALATSGARPRLHRGSRAATAALARKARKAPAPQIPDVVAKRRAALRELDAVVRPLLSRLLPVPGATVQPLTAYDAVYAATPEIGGHWTVSAVWVGPFAHTTLTYTVAVAFDAAEPKYFVITGAQETRTPDATPAALAEGLARARTSGPLQITTQHAFLVPAL